MTREEKQLMEMVQKSAETVEVPESLEPEAVCSRLAGLEKKSRWTKRRYVCLAACLGVLLLGGGVLRFAWNHPGEERTVSTAKGTGENVKTASDYEEVYQYLAAAAEKNSAVYDAGVSTGSSFMTKDSAASESASYSTTNVRTEGVGEADIVKTDGAFLYVLQDSTTEIAVVDVRDTEMKVAGRIGLPDGFSVSEFYVEGDRMYVLGNQEKVKRDDMDFYYGNDAVLLTYDISDPKDGKLLDSLQQSGTYLTSRFTDGYLYLFSIFRVGSEISQSDPAGYIPQARGDFLNNDEIFLPAGGSADQYLVVTSVDASNPGEVVQKRAVLTDSGQCYVGPDNIYLYELQWDEGFTGQGSSETVIWKIAYDKGKFEDTAKGRVKGYLKDSFCIDEYEGNLRVVTTVDTSTSETNAVYVLNDKMAVVGKIEDLAKGEVVYSARMMGDIGYFVTYEQTDPLFSVDLSDPENPAILGELKIPGFSEYLHPYGDGLLLGIGMDTDPESGVINGVKVSMYDVSDPANVKELENYVIDGTHYTEAGTDYRAVLADPEKNLIGFSAYGDQEKYYIFQYDPEKGFLRKLEEAVNGALMLATRGVYADQTYYVVKGNAIESYEMQNYTKTDDLLL